jgi:hypothetical protein
MKEFMYKVLAELQEDGVQNNDYFRKKEQIVKKVWVAPKVSNETTVE